MAKINQYGDQNVAIGENYGSIVINYGEKKIKRFLTSPPFNPPVFIGRESELEEVHQKLFAEKLFDTSKVSDKSSNFLMLVNGQGGIGKTSFASKYWEKYQNEYSHLAFLFIGDYLSDKYSPIANALLSLSQELGLKFTTETTQEQLGILIKTVSNLQKPCLLILDNANNESDLNENILILRKCNNFHILLTSRLADFEYAQKYPLGTLNKRQALELFKKHYALLQDSEIPLFEEIYESVAGNTLVLEILAKNLNNFNNKLKKRYTLQALKEDLQKSLLKLSMSKEVRTEYQAKGTGLRTETPESIILAMYDLTDLQESEIALLSIFAVLPAQNIDFETLSNFLTNENLDETLLSLAQKGWIEQNETAFKISPVIQEIVRHKNQDRLFADCEKMIRFLIEELHFDKIYQKNYKSYAIYIDYSIHILTTKVLNNIYVISFLGDIIIGYSHRIGNINFMLFMCENLLVKLEQHNELTFPTSHKNRFLAVLYGKKGLAYRLLGDLELALDCFNKAFKLKEELYSQEDTIINKNGFAIANEYLGDYYMQVGDYQSAYNYFNKFNSLLMEIYSENGKYPYYLNFTISFFKLGEVKQYLSEYENALMYYKKYNHFAHKLYELLPNDIRGKKELAISFDKVGEMYSRLENTDMALKYIKKGNYLFRELCDENPEDANFKNGLAVSCNYLANIYKYIGLDSISLYFFEEENKLMNELINTSPENVLFKDGLSSSYLNLGLFYEILDKQKAKTYYLESQKLLSELVKSFPAYVEFQNNLQWVENQLKKL